MTKENLERALRELPLKNLTVVVNLDGRRLTAVVTAPKFTNMDEAERQRIVWGHFRKRFSDHELVRLEFIFTNAPGEATAAESAE
jgi:acid stress-induced BolA-like protein IbaG/YrbA